MMLKTGACIVILCLLSIPHFSLFLAEAIALQMAVGGAVLKKRVHVQIPN